MEFLTLSPVAIAAIPVIVGVVEVAKLLGAPSRFASLIALAAGTAIVALSGASWQAALLQGMMAGLSASGLYSGAKKLAE